MKLTRDQFDDTDTVRLFNVPANHSHNVWISEPIVELEEFTNDWFVLTDAIGETIRTGSWEELETIIHSAESFFIG